MAVKGEGQVDDPTSSADAPVDDAASSASLTERAYRQIEELIVTLALPPKMVLSEQLLSERLKIGRTPVREALQQLARDGLIVILPRRGVLVSDINVRTQLRLLELRREVERLMARVAAERATPAEAATFRQLATDMRQAADAADDIAFMRLDRELNSLISEAARNEFATRSMGLMHGLSRRFWYQHYREAADLPLAATLHAALADSIGGRDSAAAAQASDALISYIESFARKTIDS
ncbi:MAG: GntR family transcriptional regulator [Beijerinckiaceae bacterium]